MHLVQGHHDLYTKFLKLAQLKILRERERERVLVVTKGNLFCIHIQGKKKTL